MFILDIFVYYNICEFVFFFDGCLICDLWLEWRCEGIGDFGFFCFAVLLFLNYSFYFED